MDACTKFVLLTSLIPASRAVTTGVSTELTLDCSLATYILIGITALYSLLSLICIVLIIVACRCCKKKTRGKVQPEYDEEELDDVFLPSSSHLESIAETTTTDLVVENKYYSFASKKSNSSSESSESSFSDNDSNKETSVHVVIHNRSAKSKSKSPRTGPQSELRERQLTGQLSNNSPFLSHHPKASPIAPSKVKVPFSETVETVDSEEKSVHPPPIPAGHGPVRLPPIHRRGTPRQRRKIVAMTLTNNDGHQSSESHQLGITNPPSSRGLKSSPSPFNKRKVPHKEVAMDSDKNSPVIRKVVNRKPDQHVVTGSALKFEMVKISHKWSEVGTGFRLSTNTLTNIYRLYGDEYDKCMLQVCEEWLKIRKDRTWTEVIDILRREEIRERTLANYLHSYYCTTGAVLPQLNQGPNGLGEGGDNDAEGSLSWL